MSRGIQTPLSPNSGVPLTLSQLQDVYDTVDQIVEHLDEAALNELMGGYEKDVDKVLNILVEEASAVIASNNRTMNTGAFGYLDRFADSVEETLRCRSFNYFILTTLPDFILGWHNIEWGNLVQMYRMLGILAARDHGKSYEFSFAYPLWQLYRYKKTLPMGNLAPKELRMAREGLLVTNEYGLARHLLSILKEEVENNEILANRLLPDNKRNGWGSEKILTKNGASMTIKSAQSKIRGYHPTWIVLDDFLNESSLYSQDQRDKYWNVFSGILIPALSPGGQMVVVGTPFFEKDLYGVLREKGLFPIFEYPAIYPDGRLLFPERHTFDSIMEKRELLGSLIFSRELLVKPISDAAAIFPYDILNNAIRGQDKTMLCNTRESSPIEFERIVVGCDFAISSSIGADYSVFTIGGIDSLGKIHVLNCWRKAGANYRQQVAALKKINRDFRPDLFVVETNGMQQIFLQMLEEAGLPVVGKHTGNDKKSMYKGVPAMAILFEANMIKFPYGDQKAKDFTDLYFSELNSITFIQDKGTLESVSQHDDTSMSLWQLVKGLKNGVDDFDFAWL